MNMTFLTTIILFILSSIWYIISYKILTKEIGLITTNNLDYSILLYLAGMFVFGVLFGKTLIKNKSKREKKEYEEFLVYKNKKLSEEILETTNNNNFSEEIFIFEKDKKNISKTYNNYEKEYEKTKNSIDIILDEKKIISKHNINLEKEKRKNKISSKKENLILKNKSLKKEYNVIKNKNLNKNNELEDTMFKNVANNLLKKRKQDLTIIEGIGPKIQELLNKDGIYSYNDLANSEISKIQNILKNAGKRYLMLHNPSTWSKQAKIANKGKFNELKKYQDKLVKGVEV